MKGLFLQALCAIACVGYANSYAMESYFDKSVQEQVQNSLAYWSEMRSFKGGIQMPVSQATVYFDAPQIAAIAPEIVQAPQVTIVNPEMVEQVTKQANSYLDYVTQGAKNNLSRAGAYVSSTWSTMAKPVLSKMWNGISQSKVAERCNSWYQAAAPHVQSYAQKLQPYTVDVIKAHPYVASAVAAGAVVGTAGYIYRKPIMRAIRRATGRPEDYGVRFVELADDMTDTIKTVKTPEGKKLMRALIKDIKAIKKERTTDEATSAYFLINCSHETIQETQNEIRNLFNAMISGCYYDSCNQVQIKTDSARFKEIVLNAFKRAADKIEAEL